MTTKRYKCKIRHVSNPQIRYFAYPAVFALIATLTFTSGFFNNPKANAATEAARWTKVNIPAEGEAGGWALANGADIKHLTLAADGTLFAYGAGLAYTLLKSTNGGLKWSGTGKVQDVIKDIAVSPHDTRNVYYATAESVYRSTDGGKSFNALPEVPGAGTGNVEITSIAAGWLNGEIIAAGTRDTDSAQYGGVYTFDSSDAPSWVDTGIGSYDVYDVAFPPDYGANRQIAAAVTDETDTFIFNKTGDGGWNAIIGAAKLSKDNAAAGAVAITESAVIAFPDNYTSDIGEAECFFYAGINTGAGDGDVYKIECLSAPSASIATDLDAGGTNNTDITGLAAYSGEGAVTLLAGPASAGRIYISTNGGKSWTKSRKSPTGNADTYVLFSNDFNSNGIMYAATSGSGSALSISRDTGDNWNQVSLIDTAISNIMDMAPSPAYSEDNTLLMITQGGTPASGGLWRTTDGGLSWERILSGFYPGVDVLSRASLPPQYGNDCQTLYIAGESNGNTVIWESNDNGQRFRARQLTDPSTGTSIPVDAWTIADENTIYIGSYDGAHGMIYKTVDGGLTLTEGTPTGSHSIYSIALSPDFSNDGTILAGNSDGDVSLSTDGSISFVPLINDTASGALTGHIGVAFDPGFKENRTIYASSDTQDAGLYRYKIDTSDYWENIDGTLPSDATINSLTISGSGVLYGANSDIEGGIERGLSPGASYPLFETVTRGLSAGVTLSGIRQVGSQLWAIDTTNCKLMTYIDTLISPAVQTQPENNASGISGMVDHAVKNIEIDWESLEGATSYQWQCTYSTDFSTISSGMEGTAEASSAHLPVLDPATTYYWRVRANAPVLSPWSEKWSFTTSLDTEVVTLKPESPTAGAAGVPIRPVFQWTAVVGASSYELLVADNAEFDDPVIIKMGDYTLPTSAWECDVSLDYGTTYYWEVRAINAGTHSTWSSAGVFTTMDIPTEAYLEGELPEGQDTMMLLSPAQKASTEQLLPPSAATPSSPAEQATESSQLTTIPGWIIYLIGGLLAIVMMALVIILTVVLKIKRF